MMTLRALRLASLPPSRVYFALALVIAATVASTNEAPAQANDPIVAKVNGIAIRQSNLAQAEAEVGRNFPSDDADRKRDFLVNYLTDMILITGAANGSKAADDAGIQRRVTFVKDKVLMERVIDNINKNAVTESTMRKAYDEIAANMAGQEEFHVSSILVRIPADATAQTKNGIEAKINAAAERVRKGEDFGTVAKEVSEDPTSRQRGGDFGYLGKHQMEPKFFEVVARLGDGQVSEVFATESGWMIAKVMGRRLRQVPPYDQVQSQVEAYVKGRAQFVLVEKLRAEAKIERLDKPQDAKP